MNGLYKDPLAESYDDDLQYEQEAVGTTAEFLGIGSAIGSVSSSIGSLLGGGGRRQPVRHVRDNRTTVAPGVRDARLETPRGNATIRLPDEVVPKRLFDEATAELQQSVTGVTARMNTIEQKDLPEMKKELGALLANTRQAIADEKKARLRAMFRHARALKSMQTNSLMMSLLFQRQLQNQLASHSHSALDATPTGSPITEPVALNTGDNNSLLFLPMMMMGDGGGSYSEREDGAEGNYREDGNDNSMMMMMMMLTLAK